VAAVPDGETLTLADGREVRLAGILAPRPPLGWPPERPWRLAEQAKAALAELASGRRVELRRDGDAEGDRYGRVLAQVYRVDGLWLQGELLRRGLARVATLAEHR